MTRRVVITGFGVISPCGNTAPETWDISEWAQRRRVDHAL